MNAPEHPNRAAAGAETRRNVAVAGRGTALTGAQQNRLRELAARFPGLDFSPIGLPARPAAA